MAEREELDALYDGAILAHGFVPFMRDYQMDVERWADQESGAPFTYRFTHCVHAESTSLLSAESGTSHGARQRTWQRGRLAATVVSPGE